MANQIKYHHFIMLGGGVVLLGLGSATVSYANGILSSSDATTLSATSTTKLTNIRNMG